MIVEHSELFQSWLVKVLKSLCDADPDALAKYVLALIKKEKTENQVRLSMIDQLDVFLQGDTKPFVEKLFEALRNKEYLTTRTSSESGQSSNDMESESGEDDNGNSDSSPLISVKGDESNESLMTESPVSSSSSSPTAFVSTSTNQPSFLTIAAQTTSPENEVSPSTKKGSIVVSVSVTPSAQLNSEDNNHPSQSATDADSGGVVVVSGNRDDFRGKRDRRDDNRDKRRKRLRIDRERRCSTSTSRSADRIKRSQSPTLERDRNWSRNARVSRRPKKPPLPRRYDRSIWGRRRSSKSPLRNRSASPRNKSRTAHRYRRPVNFSRPRSRSPTATSKDKKNFLLPIPPVPSDHDLALKEFADKTLMHSVVRSGASQTDGSKLKPGPGYTPVAQTGSGCRCRDFDVKGFCMRGELCPFDHGKDPVVLEDVVVFGVGPGGPPGYGATGMPQPGSSGYNPPLRPPGMIGEYFPDRSSLESSVGWGPGGPSFRPRHLGPPSRNRGGLMVRPPAGMGPYPIPGQRQLISVHMVGMPPPVPVMGDMRGPHPPMPPIPMPLHPCMRGLHGMRGRGREGFGYCRLGAPVRNFTNCCLEVRKIPREQNTIMELNSHFSRFGKIINIQINYDNAPEAALVTFSSPVEAQQAYKSSEAVFNNRFIRVFWHNKEKENEEDMEQQHHAGPPRIPVQERLGPQPEIPLERESKILLSGNNLTEAVYHNALLEKKVGTPQDKLQAHCTYLHEKTVESIKRSQVLLAAQVNLKNLQEQKKQDALKMSNDLRKRQHTIMEEQINQQKKLIAKLESGKLKQEEKEETLRILKILQESVTKLKNDLDESNPKLLNQGMHVALQPRENLREEAQREMLDAELDLYNEEHQGGSTCDLEKRVIELRARAKSLGLIGGARGRGVYRGVGRGFRGGRGMMRRSLVSCRRGRGMVHGLRSVDRRPTKLRVSGWPASRLPDLMQHLNLFGPTRDYVSEGDAFIVDFDSRKGAENVMANGQLLEDVKLQLEWVTGSILSPKVDPGDALNNTEASNNNDINQNASTDEDDDELDDDGILNINNEVLIPGEEDDEDEVDEEDRSWRR